MVRRRTPRLVPEEKKNIELNVTSYQAFSGLSLSLFFAKSALGDLWGSCCPYPLGWLGWFNMPETSQQKAAAPEKRCGDTSRHHKPCQWGAPHGSWCSPSLRQLVELLDCFCKVHHEIYCNLIEPVTVIKFPGQWCSNFSMSCEMTRVGPQSIAEKPKLRANLKLTKSLSRYLAPGCYQPKIE